MSYTIINEFTFQHHVGPFPALEKIGVRSDTNHYYIVKVPLRIEKQWSANKRDKVSNACMYSFDQARNRYYVVYDRGTIDSYKYLKALIKFIMNME